MNWVAKAAVFKLIDSLPFRERIYHFIQDRVVHTTVLRPDYFELKLRDSVAHMECYARFGRRPLAASCILELGTGWHPVVPVALYLQGADCILTVDSRLHVKPVMLQEVFHLFVDYADSGRLADILPESRPERLEKVRELVGAETGSTVEETLERLGIRLLIGDARGLDLPDGSVDLVVSNNTLEHIPETVLPPIFHEFRRLLASDGIMSHFIDMSDHYAHVDRSITDYNFLAFSDRTWRMIDNSLIHLNRLRVSDYRALLDNDGFRLVHEEDIVAQGPEPLERVRLAPRFRSYDRSDLLVTHCRLVHTV